MSRPIASRLLGRRDLVRIGCLRVPSYTALLYLGCLSGVMAGAAVARSAGLDPGVFALTTTMLLVPAFVGARLWFVAQHFEVFRADPARLWRRSEGGSSLYGGLVFGVIFSLPVLAIVGLPFLGFWDAAAITMLVGLILTRIGCLLHGCCAGRETASRLGVRLPDYRGRWLRRYPTPLLEAAWGGIVLAAVLVLWPESARPGALFGAIVASYALGRLVLEPTRESAQPKRELRVNVLFSAALVLAGGSLLAATLPA